MLIQTSPQFRTLFLLKFTELLIKNSLPLQIQKNYSEKKSKDDLLSKKIEKAIQQKRTQNIPIKNQLPLPKIQIRRELNQRGPQFNVYSTDQTSQPTQRILKIPQPKLPPELQYIKPVINEKVQLNLEKLNPLIQDPLVNSIECPGEGENIIVKGTRGAMQTKIVLNKKEIDEIIQKFSEAAKIPAEEGIFRVAVGKFIFFAIVSNVISSKFIIQKINNRPFQARMLPR